jgi:lipopolysaccharide biosynthesis glycosyltransferase
MGGDLQTTRGLLALTHSIIRNYNPNTSANTNTMHDNLCLFIFSTKEDLDEKKQSLECAVNSMENVDLSHVRIIHKIIDKQNWFPRVYSLSEADKLGMEYKWFRYYLSPNDVEGLNKILYLDTDMIIEGNIAELFEWDMNGHVVAATNYWEPLRNHLCHSHKLGDIAMKTDEIGFIGNAKTITPFETSNHINTGLLLIDLEMMLNQRILKNWSRLLDIHESEECLWLEEYSGEADFTLAINGDAEILPEEWNVGNLGSPEMYRLIGGCERANALHWNGAAKPYTNIGRTHALCLEYFIKYDVIPALLQSDPGCYNFQQLKK